MAADARGRAIASAPAPGRAHEAPMAPPLPGGLPDAPMAPPLPGGLPDAPLWVAGDRGLSSAMVREQAWGMGARPAIPPRRNEEQVACPPWIHNNRNRVERLWARLKEWRAVAARHEKTARCSLGVLCLAAAQDWLKD